MSDHAFLKTVEKLLSTMGSLSYYEILNISENATGDEIKKSFLSLTRQYHPDRHISTNSDDLNKKLNTIFASITEAYSTLSHPGKRQEYDRSRQTMAEKNALQNLSKEQRAEMFFADGQEKLLQNELEEAKTLFLQAIHFDESNPVYHYGLARVYTSMKKHAEAARTLGTAVKLKPEDAHYHTALGYAFIEIGLLKRAQGCFQRSLKILPDNTAAANGLQKVEALL